MTPPETAARRHLDPTSLPFTVLLALVTAMQAIGTTFTIPALPAIAQAFGSTTDLAQLTISGYLAGLACGQILFGALSDRYGRRPVLLGGMILFVITGIACTFAGDIRVLVGARVLQGFGGGAGMILGRAIVRDIYERDQALRVMSVMIGIMTMTPMVSPFLGGMLLHWMSWRGIFGTLTVISAVLTVLAWIHIGESLKKPDLDAMNPRRIIANCREILTRPDACSFPLMAALIFSGMFIYLTLVPFIAVDTFGLTPADGGWLVGLNGMALWSGAVFNSRTAGRRPVRRMLWLSSSIALGASLITLATTLAVTYGLLGGKLGLVLIAVPSMVYCFTFGITQPNTIVMGLHPVPHIAGVASALGATMQMGSAAIFTWVAGLMYNGTPLALGLLHAATAVASFLVYALVAVKYTPAPPASRAARS
jgi:DHA1 family bicyclomycin/chloramphenicol resistance-like MFS transporter